MKQQKRVKVKGADWSPGEGGREMGGESEQGRHVPGWLQGFPASDSPHCGSPGLGASFWVAPPAMSLLIKCVLKVRLSVETMSHL